MQPAKLTLWFERHGDAPVQLRRTTFTRQDLMQPLQAERGAYEGTFKWSAGVKSLMVFLLRSAAESLHEPQETDDEIDPYVLQGKRPSVAASLNDVLTKAPAWIYDVFGTTIGDLPFLSEIVRRQNADFSSQPGGDVSLWLDPDRFSPGNIEVKLNGRAVREVRILDELAEEIARQWRPQRRATQLVPHEHDQSSLASSYQTLQPSGVERHFGLLMELMHEDVEFTHCGVPELGLSGRWKGRQQVLEVIAANVAGFEFQEPRIHTLVSDESNLVVMAQERSKRVDQPDVRVVEWAQRIRFRDGKIVGAHVVVAPSWESECEP